MYCFLSKFFFIFFIFAISGCTSTNTTSQTTVIIPKGTPVINANDLPQIWSKETYLRLSESRFSETERKIMLAAVMAKMNLVNETKCEHFDLKSILRDRQDIDSKLRNEIWMVEGCGASKKYPIYDKSGQVYYAAYEILSEPDYDKLPKYVGYSNFKIGKKYEELNQAEKQWIRKQYVNMPADDEPPYPLNGFEPIIQQISNFQQIIYTEGKLKLEISVDSTGTAKSVSILQTPNEKMSNFVVAVFMNEKYKPAVCGGVVCRMSIPFEIVFKRQ